MRTKCMAVIVYEEYQVVKQFAFLPKMLGPK